MHAFVTPPFICIACIVLQDEISCVHRKVIVSLYVCMSIPTYTSLIFFFFSDRYTNTTRNQRYDHRRSTHKLQEMTVTLADAAGLLPQYCQTNYS